MTLLQVEEGKLQSPGRSKTPLKSCWRTSTPSRLWLSFNWPLDIVLMTFFFFLFYWNFQPWMNCLDLDTKKKEPSPEKMMVLSHELTKTVWTILSTLNSSTFNIKVILLSTKEDEWIWMKRLICLKVSTHTQENKAQLWAWSVLQNNQGRDAWSKALKAGDYFPPTAPQVCGVRKQRRTCPRSVKSLRLELLFWVDCLVRLLKIALLIVPVF